MALNQNSPLQASTSAVLNPSLEQVQQRPRKAGVFSALKRIAPCAMLFCSPRVVTASEMCTPPTTLIPINTQLAEFGAAISASLHPEGGPLEDASNSYGQKMMQKLTTALARLPIYGCAAEHLCGSQNIPALSFNVEKDGQDLILNDLVEGADETCLLTMTASAQQAIEARESDIEKLHQMATASLNTSPNRYEVSALYAGFVTSVLSELKNAHHPSLASPEDLLNFVVDVGLNYFSRAQKVKDLDRLTYKTPLLAVTVAAVAAVLLLGIDRERQERLQRAGEQILLYIELLTNVLEGGWAHRPNQWPYGQMTLPELRKHVETVKPLLDRLGDFIEDKIYQKSEPGLSPFYDEIQAAPFCYPMRLPLLDREGNAIRSDAHQRAEELHDLPQLLINNNVEQDGLDLSMLRMRVSEFCTHTRDIRSFDDLEPVPSRSLPEMLKKISKANDISQVLKEIYPEVSQAQIASLRFLCGMTNDQHTDMGS